MDDKQYRPDTMPDIALPSTQIVGVPGGRATGKPDETIKPETISDTRFPLGIIARETISESLDTHSKRILGTYGFGQAGAIKVGKYVAGVSGEIDISPGGIVAVNSSGDNTFTLDGETGDATFAGQITAGALVTGNVRIQAQGNIIVNDGTTDRVLIGYQSGGF